MSTLINSPWKRNATLDLECLHLIGTGSFGRVYKARQTLLGNIEFHYAVKQIFVYKTLQQFEWDPVKMLREVILLQEINHTNVVRYYSFWLNGLGWESSRPESPQFSSTRADSEFLYTVMELCDFSLKKWLAENSNMQSRQGFIPGIMLNALSGLSYLHDRSIIHRDLKPDNILGRRDVNGLVEWKIGDLGLARKYGQDDLQSEMVGCLEYRSPENENSKMADVYALGKTFSNLFPKDVPGSTTGYPFSCQIDPVGFPCDKVLTLIKNMCHQDKYLRPVVKQVKLDVKSILDFDKNMTAAGVTKCSKVAG
ncbi:interferon-induced, double-stranded RNA-activated protein kinase-like [Folsomia candida]|nr:interferon-induced, double-stranded RNA-activated protein kinase-like [Folsomia candida]